VTSTSDFVVSATRLAAAGVPVFPCVPGGKTPLTPHGFKDATTSAAQIERWSLRWPDANLAIATGGEGIDVVDVDAHASGHGFPVLERARRAGLVDGWSAVVRTPSGGLHFYYPATAGHPQRSWSLGQAHIDFRGEGGYALVAPSAVHRADGSSGGYEVIAVGRHPHPVDALALKEFLQPRATTPAQQSRRIGPASSDRGERIAAWVSRRPEGTRNGSLYWAACRLAEQSVPERDAQGLLVGAAQRAGLPRAEAVATIHSAYQQTGPERSRASGGAGMGMSR